MKPSRSSLGVAMVRVSQRQIAALSVITLVSLVYLSVAYRAIRSTLEPFDSWQTGDWLINYSGGFVRRGLAGTVILGVTPESWSPSLTVSVVQLAFLAIVYVGAIVLFLRTERSPAWIMALLSPATLLFPLLNPLGGLRKEVLALAVVAIVAVGTTSRRPLVFGIPALLIFSLAILSHEATVLVLPSIFVLLWARSNSSQVTSADRFLAAAFAAVGIAGFALSLVFRGTPAETKAISDSWSERGLTWSPGALEALALPTGDAMDKLWSFFPDYWGYLPYLALSVLPLYATRFLPQEWRITGLVAVATLPLFLVAWDYGRWIYLGIMQLLFIALILHDRLKPAMRVPILGVAAFALLWGMGFHGNPTAPSVFELFTHFFN